MLLRKLGGLYTVIALSFPQRESAEGKMRITHSPFCFRPVPSMKLPLPVSTRQLSEDDRASESIPSTFQSRSGLIGVPLGAAGFYIPSLPGLASTTLSMYGGLLPSAPTVNGIKDTSDAHLYFHFVKNKHISSTPKLLIWFNGGPGKFFLSLFGNIAHFSTFQVVRLSMARQSILRTASLYSLT